LNKSSPIERSTFKIAGVTRKNPKANPTEKQIKNNRVLIKITEFLIPMILVKKVKMEGITISIFEEQM